MIVSELICKFTATGAPFLMRISLNVFHRLIQNSVADA